MDIETNKDTPIKSWWKKVIQSNNNSNQAVTQKQEEDQIFGVPLQQSLHCAHAAIAYVDNDVQYVGFIPVIVAKCGSFLKDQGLYTEGVFRMSGSAKRIGLLQQIFNTYPNYGRQLDWKGFSVHDAANVLRRYLNYLPEPVITHNLYQPFRDVVSSQASEEEKVQQFQSLIEQLPEHHQYLLFYLLDLLSLFSQNVQITKMDTYNLASVFTPGMLLSPEHAMNPVQYKTSQKVIQFLIEHQQCFKMPRSSWYTVANPNKEPVTTTTAMPVEKDSNISHGSNINNNNNNNNNNDFSTTTTTASSSSPPSSPVAPLSPGRSASVNIKSNKDQRIKRAKTMPSRRSKYGPNDPLQVVQLNKQTESG